MSGRKRGPLSQSQISTEEDVHSSRKKARHEINPSESDKRAGTITHMILKNFMCHSLLEVRFNNNKTMIIGKNGSGKSAILTALVVGLGGRATTTNRGKSVKGFVKAGKLSGSIEIDLCNEGSMAYKPSIYGKRINIVRHLNANGGGSYKIRSETGEVISTQSKEVQNITAAFNIQVDNPVCILNQDTSRNFLSSNDPKQKFNLFVRATQLDVLENEYKKTELNKNNLAKTISEKEDNLKKLHEEVKRLKRKIDIHKSIGTLKNRKHLLERELAWAKVRDVEEELEIELENLKNCQAKSDEVRGNSEKRLGRLEALKRKISDTEQTLKELKAQIDVQKRPQLDLKGEIDELMTQYKTKKRDIVQIQTSIDIKMRDMNTLINDIASSKESMSNVEQQKMEKIKKLTNLQDKLKAMDDHLETTKNDLFQIKSDLSRKEDAEGNLRSELRQLDHKMNEHKNNLSALQSESENDLVLYGRDMPKLKQMIERCRNQFQQLPRGPLGSYIKLRDKKWAVAVEGYIGPGLLGAFTVDNKNDNKLLRDILKKVWTCGKPPLIITSKFINRKHDISRNITAEPPGCTSLFNVLEIEDSIVSNRIVDSVSPENILLIPDDRRAQELLSNRTTVPRNCSQGVTIRGDRYYPDPNYRTYGSRYHRAKYLQVDRKEYIQQLQSSIEHVAAKRKTVFAQLEAFQRDMKQQVERKDELEEKVRKVHAARNQLKRQLEELKNSAEPEVQNFQYLEHEVDELKKSIADKKANLEKLSVDIKEIKKCITTKQENLSQLKESTESFEERIQKLKDELRENQTKHQEISTGDEFDKRRIRELEVKLKEAQAAYNLREKALKKVSEDATNVGERPTELRQVAAISSDINEINSRIDTIERDNENICDVMDRYNELFGKYNQSSSVMRNLKDDLDELSIAVERRSGHYKITETYFIAYMKKSFEKVLNLRQFSGTIDIDMKKKKLELIVMPQQGSQGHTTTSNLSGGERSFSTVAFLYSLWQCMDFPFYFLDEFDVYMDKMNRSKVIDILMQHANSKPDLQFVFLTPQDVSFISDDVSILRLENPERRSQQL